MEQSKAPLLNLYTPSGLGDIHWTLIKLDGIRESLNRRIIVCFEKNPYHNALDVTRLMLMTPSVESTKLSMKSQVRSERFFNAYPHISKAFKGVVGDSYYFWIGHEIATSKKKSLKEILPEIPCNYDYEINLPEEAEEYAQRMLLSVGRPLIITNASWRSVDKSQVANYWSVEHYVKTAKLFYDYYKAPTLLLGSFAEEELARKICKGNSYFINLVNRVPITNILGLIKNSDLIWGFQGGLSMLADRFEKPIVMLWTTQTHTRAKHNAPENLISAWVRPESISTGRYIPLILGKDATPDNIFNQSKRLVDGMGKRRLH